MRKEPRKTFYLGTAVEITTIFSVATLTTATITILDPSLVVKINSANMTKQVDKVYQYIYQSTSTDIDGVYVIQITATSGGYTTYFEDNIRFIKQTGD
jgi:hypothetical protein